jgi:hypothetical protein
VTLQTDDNVAVSKVVVGGQQVVSNQNGKLINQQLEAEFGILLATKVRGMVLSATTKVTN